MGYPIKQSTAVVVSFGPFVAPSDGVTLVTSLVSALDHASTGIFLSKNGGTLTIRHATVTASTYDAYGNYKVTLDTTDTNTLGAMRMQFAAAASCLPVWLDFEVMPANVWDSLYGSDNLQVDVTKWLDGTIPAVNVTGVPLVDAKYLLGTVFPTPTVAGIPNVNVKTWNDLATVALPLVPATAGRTLVVDAAGLADANTVKLGPTGAGTAQTARDIGTSVLISSGTGTGQLDVTSGTIRSDLKKCGGSTVAAGAIPNAAAGAASGLLIAGSNAATTFATLTSTGAFSVNGVSDVAQTGDSYARLGAPAGASVSADVAAAKADTAAIKTKTDQLVFSTANRVNCQVYGMEAGTVTAAALADGAIDRATFAVDTGLQTVRSNTCQSGSTLNSIRLDGSASATTDDYKGLGVYVTGGTSMGQYRVITAYNGSTKQATVDRAFGTAPDNTSTFALVPDDAPALNANLQPSIALQSVAIRTGTAQGGSTSSTIKLDASAIATNNIYNNNTISTTGGTGPGQTRTIISYNGTTKVATISPAWTTTPDNTTTFAIYASTTPSQFSDQGVAQAASASTITLASTASAANSIYVGSLVTILAGTDSGDTAEITAYNGSTKVATISGTFAVTPDTTSAYAVIPTQSGTGVTSGTQDVNILTWAGTAVSGLPSNFSALSLDASGRVTLAAAGLDAVNITQPTGAASTFREMIVAGWMRQYNKTVYDSSGNSLKVYASDSSTVVTTQTLTVSGGVQTQGKAA